jgi:BA14K-like protein
MRKTIAAALLAATCGTGLAAIDARPAAAKDAVRVDLHQAYPSESYAQYRRYGGRYYGRSYRRGYGGAAAAGIAGLAAGALIGGAIASQQYAAPPPPPYAVAPAGDANWLAYCSQKYRSFDPASGTYLSHDGNRYMCQ